MADLFGVRTVGTRPERLLQHFAIDGSVPLAKGVVEQSLQYHGEASEYALEGATALACLHQDADTPSSEPAVTIHRYGKGSAVAFAFDLAKSVVLMRQGNPQWQNTEGDTKSGYRPMDLFMRSEGETYFDSKRLTIPQADEKQRFLANLILRLAEKPLPRMWYLPAMHKVVMVNTGDGEANYGPEIAPVLDACASYGGRFSVYLMNWDKARGIDRTSVEEEAAWRAAGHEVGVHVYGGGPDGEGAYDTLREAYAKITADLKGKFAHGARTVRNHTIDWTGWVDMAAIEAEFGTRMDMNYYHYIPCESPIDTRGYFNGTGLPQRFIDARGQMLPIYQTTTQWPDEWFADHKITAEQTVEIITNMFQAARNGFYSAFVNNIHPPRYNAIYAKDPITPVWPHTVWAYCRDQGIPLWSGEMLLDFLEARNRTRLENIAWQTDSEPGAHRLSFDFQAPSAREDLTILIPSGWSGRRLGVLTVDGKAVEVATEVIKGIEYARFTPTAARAQVVADYR
ncbi:MAG: hypothetical protein A2V98_04730 [Planctomycetes bacterium RBG_16_64_12]|nr:MAG: hypothetical protein A2V98_04730 [Planctomycetes bacterium RBG_16_64_12]